MCEINTLFRVLGLPEVLIWTGIFLDPGKYTCLGSKLRKEMGTKIEFLFALACGPKSWLYRDTILIACNVYFLIFDLFLGFV